MPYNFRRMTPAHPRWSEFKRRLEGPEGCNFQRSPDGDLDKTTWHCSARNSRPHAHQILRAMGFGSEFIDASMTYFDSRGGFCDCEILWNVTDRSFRRSRLKRIRARILRSRRGRNPVWQAA